MENNVLVCAGTHSICIRWFFEFNTNGLPLIAAITAQYLIAPTSQRKVMEQRSPKKAKPCEAPEKVAKKGPTPKKAKKGLRSPPKRLAKLLKAWSIESSLKAQEHRMSRKVKQHC
jgi:hypothetical protein